MIQDFKLWQLLGEIPVGNNGAQETVSVSLGVDEPTEGTSSLFCIYYNYRLFYFVYSTTILNI